MEPESFVKVEVESFVKVEQKLKLNQQLASHQRSNAKKMKNGKLPRTRPSVFSSTNNHSNPLVSSNQIFPPKPLEYNESLSYRPTVTWSTSLSSTLQQYINSDTPFGGQSIHTRIIKSGFIPNTNISIKLLILYLKCGALNYARQMFDGLPQRTLSAYNYMISGNLRHGLVQESLGFVRRLVLSGERPDGYTFSMILKASTSCRSNVVLLPRSLGRIVHAQIVKCDVEPDDVLYTALVDSYVKNGMVGYMSQGFVEDAEEIFSKTMEKDIVVYNAMIEGYSKSIETAKKALEALKFIQQIPGKPNSDVWAALLSSSRLHEDVEMANIAANEIVKLNANDRPGAYVALSNTLAAAGKWDNVSELREGMKLRGILKDTGYSWVGLDS
ncbi:hypothetical protein QYF36_002846 [Acer negundo]|nr:hypothetical protein QYF36_002846 [Acer negundo]